MKTPADWTVPGFNAWDVDQLIELSRGLPVQEVAVASVSQVDTGYWI